jgi:hypothetical protein
VFVVRDRSVMLSDMHFIACSICSMNCCSFATVDSSSVIFVDISVRILSKTMCLFVECVNERDTFNGCSTSRTHSTWAAINEQQPVDIRRAYETRSWYFSLFIENLFDSLLLFMFIRTCRYCRTPNTYVFAWFRFVRDAMHSSYARVVPAFSMLFVKGLVQQLDKSTLKSKTNKCHVHTARSTLVDYWPICWARFILVPVPVYVSSASVKHTSNCLQWAGPVSLTRSYLIAT